MQSNVQNFVRIYSNTIISKLCECIQLDAVYVYMLKFIWLTDFVFYWCNFICDTIWSRLIRTCDQIIAVGSTLAAAQSKFVETTQFGANSRKLIIITVLLLRLLPLLIQNKL